MVKKTIPELAEFNAYANEYMKGEVDTKLAYAIKKVKKRITPIYEQHNEALADCWLEHAQEDDKGKLLKDDKGNYLYSKEAQKLVNIKVRELNKIAYDIEPHYATAVKLTGDQSAAFTGLVIPEGEEFESL